MALFNLTDITFKPPGSATGPLASLTENKEYASSTLRFPSDIGSSDKAHYMVININEQKKTQFSGQASEKDKPFVIQNRIDNPALQPNIGGIKTLLDTALSTDAGKVVQEKFQTGVNSFLGGLSSTGKAGEVLAGLASGVGNELTQYIKAIDPIGFTRTIRRIKSTIVLYMPDTLMFSQNQNYDQVNIGGSPISGIMSAASSLMETKKKFPQANSNQLSEEYGKNLAPFFASAVLNQSALGKTIFAAATGTVVNPMMEILYSSPTPRNFQFDFQFNPRDEKEAKEVQDIIDSIRFFQAPEIKEGSGGFFLIPPAEFDISFYYNGKINPNIPPVSTCVLTNVNVNYAPSGFSAYEIPGETSAQIGRTGMPVSIIMQLSFMETEMVYKNSNLLRRPAGIGSSATQKNSGISDEYRKAGQVNEKGEGLF
jgi:hypothetical protein